MADAVDQKLLRTTKFPPEFSQRVDMKKVNVEVMKKWIAGKISEILGNEDDVVIEMCFNLLEGSRFPNIKILQIQLGGFLEKDTASFCKELWNLCLSAQANAQGVPQELLEAKKLELIQEKIEAEKAAEVARRRREEERQREREVNNLRQRERNERGGGRGRGGRGGRDYDRRRPSKSPRPSYRRRDDGDDRRRPIARDDRYVPEDRRGRYDRQARLPSRDSRSPSRSPPRRRQPRSLTRSRSRSRTPSRRHSPRRYRRSPQRRHSPDSDAELRDHKRRKISEEPQGDTIRPGHVSTHRSRSPRSERRSHTRRRSRSRDSDSPSPARQRSPRRASRDRRAKDVPRSKRSRRSRSRSKSRTTSSPSQSPPVKRDGRSNKPVGNADDMISTDGRKEQPYDKTARGRRHSASRSRSPPRRSNRRNTSSEASTTSHRIGDRDDIAVQTKPNVESTDNVARERELRERLLARRRLSQT